MDGTTIIQVTIAVEIVALIEAIIIWVSLQLENRVTDIFSKMFSWCLSFTCLALLFDIISWYCDLIPCNNIFRVSVNACSMIFGALIIMPFIYYTLDTINTNRPKKLSRWFGHIPCVLNVVCILVTMVGIFTGDTFIIENNIFSKGILYNLLSDASAVILLCIIIFVFVNKKHLERKDFIAYIIYFFVSVIPLVLSLFIENFEVTYVAVMQSILVIYTTLQLNNFTNSKIHEKYLSDMAENDTLTNIPNRRAYDRTISEISKYDTVAVIFCDVNKLKYTNDTLGHKAGDKLLIDFVSILRSHFRHDEIFRISGDEFVIIIGNLTEDRFEAKLRELRIAIDENKGIAAFGAKYGYSDIILKLINEAETEMYKDKEQYYIAHPEFTR